MSDDDLTRRCGELVVKLGIGTADEVREIRPLTGGVASDIAMVVVGERQVCVKFALAKLRVAEDWHVPTRRNRAEYQWLTFARGVVADAVPALYGWSESDEGFAMEYLAGANVHLWKDALLAGQPDDGVGASVGDLLGRLHAASVVALTNGDFDDGQFDNRDDFKAIRLEPYLLFTASRHPNIADKLTAIADDLYQTRHALVHGDVSPKNILVRGGHPVFLDAECASLGDPRFDVAFCLNHLILKAIHLPDSSADLLDAAANLWTSYAPHVTWEPTAGLEARLAELVPALMLARVDGKSPVEYLAAAAQERVRRTALALIKTPPARLADVLAAIEGK